MRDIEPAKPRTYYKGAGDVIGGQMSSMHFEERELDRLLKVDASSVLVRSLRKVDTNAVNIDKATKDRV